MSARSSTEMSGMTSKIVPYYLPPPATDPCEFGKCREYALGEAHAHVRAGSPAPELRVLHGRTSGHLEHAWIERGGVAYDWQGFRHYGEKEPLPIAEFRTKRKAEEVPMLDGSGPSLSAEEALHHVTPAKWDGLILDPPLCDEVADRKATFDEMVRMGHMTPEARAHCEAWDRAEAERQRAEDEDEGTTMTKEDYAVQACNRAKGALTRRGPLRERVEEAWSYLAPLRSDPPESARDLLVKVRKRISAKAAEGALGRVHVTLRDASDQEVQSIATLLQGIVSAVLP